MSKFRRMNSTKIMSDYFGFQNYTGFVNFIIDHRNQLGKIHYDIKDNHIARLDDWQTVMLVSILASQGIKKAKSQISNWTKYFMSKAKWQSVMPKNLTK